MLLFDSLGKSGPPGRQELRRNRPPPCRARVQTPCRRPTLSASARLPPQCARQARWPLLARCPRLPPWPASWHMDLQSPVALQVRKSHQTSIPYYFNPVIAALLTRAMQDLGQHL